MHIPEGMLSTPVTVVTGAASIAGITYAVRWVNKRFDQKKVVLMAVLGSLIFALQMLNFSVAGGTSGHFAGGAMAGIILGPWPASIIMTAVLGIQALLFKDGGVIALGANVLNLGIIGPFLGYAIYGAIVRINGSRSTKVVASFVAAWFGIVIAALFAGLEIWLSGRANLAMIMTSMGFWHALIGIGEGVITAGLVGYLLSVRPDLLGDGISTTRSSMKGVIATLLVIATGAAGLSFLASSHPDGLEYAYFETGIGSGFEEFSLVGDGGIFADYGVAGITNEAVGGALAGLVGLSVVGGILLVAFKRRKQQGAS